MFVLRYIKVFICLAFFALTTLAVSSVASAENGYLVEYQGDTGCISLDVRNASLKRVLKDVASRSGVTVFFDPEAEKQVTLKLDDVELDKGIRRLVRLSNYAMVYEKTAAGEGQQKFRLRKVSVFKESEENALEMLAVKSDSGNGSSFITTEPYDEKRMSGQEMRALSKEERMELRRDRKKARKERARNRRKQLTEQQ